MKILSVAIQSRELRMRYPSPDSAPNISAATTVMNEVPIAIRIPVKAYGTVLGAITQRKICQGVAPNI